MKMSKLILIVSQLSMVCAFAKAPVGKKTTRKFNQSEISTIHFKVVYGEKTTFFLVSIGKNGSHVAFSNNLGVRETKEISAADYEFLKSKVSNLTGVSNQKEYCMRNYIEVKTEVRELVGCLGAPNKLAENIQETANLISILF